jgi:hypothetical protein
MGSGSSGALEAEGGVEVEAKTGVEVEVEVILWGQDSSKLCRKMVYVYEMATLHYQL